jgi:hypothetical protein
MHFRSSGPTLALTLALFACGAQPRGADTNDPTAGTISPDHAPTATSPEAAVIEGHLAAYNRRDLEAFLTFFHDDVEIYSFPQNDRMVGKEAVATAFETLFASVESLEATIEQRSEHSGIVVDTERVEFRARNGDPQVLKALAIYQLREGTIYRLWLIYLQG